MLDQKLFGIEPKTLVLNMLRVDFMNQKREKPQDDKELYAPVNSDLIIALGFETKITLHNINCEHNDRLKLSENAQDLTQRLVESRWIARHMVNKTMVEKDWKGGIPVTTMWHTH